MTGLSLDHVIIGVADLEAAAAALGHVLGRSPSWRGRHPAYGTANILFRLDNAYLELLAPDPNATSDSAWTGSLGVFLQEKGEGLFSVAFQTPDVAAATSVTRERGIPVEDPAEGEGVDLDTGAVRRWSNARIPPVFTRGTRCFLIEHRSPPEALPPAPIVAEPAAALTAVTAIGIESQDVHGARWLWNTVFGLPEARVGDSWRYDLGNANLVLSEGTGSGPTPDRWSILVCRAPSLEAVRRHLGVDYEEARFFGTQGLFVTACGANFFLTQPS